MKVPLLDLGRQYSSLKGEIDAAIQTVLEHGRFIMGPEVKQLESELAEYCESRHGIGVASGTDALLLSLKSLGIGPGDEVLTSPFTFFSTAGVISRLGARPTFADIDKRTFNIDPKSVANALTDKTRAIIPVHLYGQIAEMDEIMAMADEKGISLVEDAAQAIGSTYKGKKPGAFGRTACYSFYPSKNLAAYGDGGFITTNDDDLADLIRRLRVHGARPKYYHSTVGYNSRLDTIQAAVLRIKLRYLQSWHESRREKAQRYNEMLRDTPQVRIPYVEDYNYHIFHQYTIIAENRDDLRDFLKSREIGFEIYYPVPLHMQDCYKDLGYRKGDLPVSEDLADRVISLPIFPELTGPEQDIVVDTIKEFYRGR
jgi:dTDP-4-amino-4,6-dideoxygalactose transaminase